MLPLQGAWIPSLVIRELRSCLPCGTAKKKKLHSWDELKLMMIYYLFYTLLGLVFI